MRNEIEPYRPQYTTRHRETSLRVRLSGAVLVALVALVVVAIMFGATTLASGSAMRNGGKFFIGTDNSVHQSDTSRNTCFLSLCK